MLRKIEAAPLWGPAGKVKGRAGRMRRRQAGAAGWGARCSGESVTGRLLRAGAGQGPARRDSQGPPAPSGPIHYSRCRRNQHDRRNQHVLLRRQEPRAQPKCPSALGSCFRRSTASVSLDRRRAARREPVMLTGTGSPAPPVLLRALPWQGSAMAYRPSLSVPGCTPQPLIDPFDRRSGIDRADHRLHADLHRLLVFRYRRGAGVARSRDMAGLIRIQQGCSPWL